MKVRVRVYPVQGDPETREIENGSLTTMQGLVGGLIEAVPLGNGLTLWCNEEGLIQQLPLNDHSYPLMLLGHNPIVGDFFIARTGEDGELADLTDVDLENVCRSLG